MGMVNLNGQMVIAIAGISSITKWKDTDSTDGMGKNQKQLLSNNRKLIPKLLEEYIADNGRII